MENNEKALEERELKELELMNENENREFYVYVHIRLDNNTVFYVGKGTKNRAYKPKRNNFYNNVRNSCDCKVVIIKNKLTESQAFRSEKYMIKYYVITLGYGIPIDGYRDFSNNKYLTNFTWGGEGVSGLNPYANKTPEEKETICKKISEANKGEKNGMYGKKGKDNPTYGEKNGMWGKPSPNRRKVICITTGEKFDSIKDAAIHYNIKKNNISNCCRGKLNHVGKLNDVPLQWKYLEDYDDNCLEEYKLNISDKRSKKVICITTGENFDCIKDAAEKYNIYATSISKCCNGKQKSAGELNGVRLQWKYSEDDDNESKAV